MPEFRYDCVDNAGKRTRGRIESESRDVAISLLRQRGLIPTNVSELSPKGPVTAPGLGSVSVKRLAIFTRKFATLVKTDIRLSEVFEILGDEEEGSLLPEACLFLSKQIGLGTPLDKAMAQRPRVFSRLYIKMVDAGMKSGTLDKVAENLAKLYETENELRSKLLSKLVYPFATLVFSFLIAIVLRIIGMISDSLFAMLIGFWMILIGLAFFGITRLGYSIYRQIGFKLPGIGALMRAINLARFCRIFGLQYSAGVPILEGLEVSKDVLQDPVLSRAVNGLQGRIRSGMDLRESMISVGVFPKRMVSMVGTGERAGGVEKMFEKLAEYYELEIDTASTIMTTLLYFVVFIAVAGTVAIIVLSAWGSYFGMIEGLIEEI